MLLESFEKAIASLDASPFQNLSRVFLNKKLIDDLSQANGHIIGFVKTTKSLPACFLNCNLKCNNNLSVLKVTK